MSITYRCNINSREGSKEILKDFRRDLLADGWQVYAYVLSEIETLLSTPGHKMKIYLPKA
jgi:hypothetical protein